MMVMPYFMSNESWYTTNENQELILTEAAPPDAVADYNKHRKQYIETVKGMSHDEYFEYLLTEDNDWFIFPME